MSQKKPIKKPPKKTAKTVAARVFPRSDKADDEAAVLAKIAAMPAPFRAMGERLHALGRRSAPALVPKLFYGMPGYAKGGPVICFFRADKYMTFGLTDKANFTREKGATDQLLGCAWFFTALDDATEARLSTIVRNAAS
jgi:hypothetical protein